MKKNTDLDVRLKAAEVRKAEAEALRAEAETRRVDADSSRMIKESSKMDLDIERSRLEIEGIKQTTRRNILDADKIDIECKLKLLDYERLADFDRKDKASDEENCVYRFNTPIYCTTVQTCMRKLTEWHRLKPKCDIEIIFSSPGGDIISGFELFDFIQSLRNSGHKITTGSLGYAASMAGVLLQAGDVRWVGHQAWIMVHRAAFLAIGKTYEIEDEVKFAKRLEERILDIFTSRSDLTIAKIKKNWDRKDWWISADEAIELRLVDEVRAILPEHIYNKNKNKKR